MNPVVHQHPRAPLSPKQMHNEAHPHMIAARYLVKASLAREDRWVVFVPALDVWTIVDDPQDIQATAARMITDTIKTADFTTDIDAFRPFPGSERDADEFFRNLPGMKRWPTPASQDGR